MAVESDRLGAFGGVATVVLFGLTSLCVLTVTWLALTALSVPLLGTIPAAVAATAVTASLALAAVVLQTPAGWTGRLRAAAFVLGIALLAGTAIGAVWLVVFAPVALLLGSSVGAPGASVVSLPLAAGTALSVLVGIRDTGPVAHWALNLRMIAAMLLLVFATVTLATTAWTVAWIVIALTLFAGTEGAVPLVVALVLGALVTVPLGAWFLYRELGYVRRIEREVDATPVTPEEYPELYATTGQVAAQLDVPVPTIAITDHETPEAMVVGFRPSAMHLVLSTGTIDALDDEQLRAVVAHELAHVANRDAIVMTVVSLPMLLADGLRVRIANTDREYGDDDEIELVHDGGSSNWDLGEAGGPLAIAMFVVGTVGWYVTRAIVTFLSRARELTADRTAATVTGSSALASALRTLDDEIRETPATDMRNVESISSLSVLPLEAGEEDLVDVTLGADASRDVMLGPEGEQQPSGMPLFDVDVELGIGDRLYRTHPPTEQRLETLSELEAMRESE